jgi:hypothetical protein
MNERMNESKEKNGRTERAGIIKAKNESVIQIWFSKRITKMIKY